jgi:VanZ family protein
MSRYFRFQFPWQAAMLAITIQSSISRIELPDMGFDWSDKLLHFLAYFVVGVLLARGLYHFRSQSVSDRHLLHTIWAGILFGLSDELHQWFVPGRDASVGDWIADALGIFTAVLFYKLWRINFRKR